LLLPQKYKLEEGKVLAEYGDKMKFPSAYGIAISDPYGHGAIEGFKSNWTINKTWINQLYLGRETSTLDKVIVELSKVKKAIPPDCLIFIAHYGNGIDNIITALDSLGIKNPIFATSTLSVSDWRASIKQILPKYDWYTCVPNYQTKEGYNDVIKDFLTFTLEKTAKCIIATEKDPTKSFDDYWKSEKVPENIDIPFDSNGDMIIPMRCISKNDL
jgi:ABC-type branched-subunit amino acid transport system substrate-binding protein